MKNFENYYKNQLHWSAGPHLFVAPDKIWVFTPLTTSGVHSPSWNNVSWGVEMVGDYETDPLDSSVFSNTVLALSSLSKLASLPPSSLRFHKEDPLTTHITCPGKNVIKDEVISAMTQKLADKNILLAAEHLPERNLAVTP